MAETPCLGGPIGIEHTAPTRWRRGSPLSVNPARAPYEPVPPVEYDEDGYPYSDGRFEMEEDSHSPPLHALLDALCAVFKGRNDMYFCVRHGAFFEKGNRRAVVVPDLVVVFGTPRRSRNSFKLWEEPKAPIS